jgi:hypothetical protein
VSNTRQDLEQLCSDLDLAIIIVRDPYHGWHAKVSSRLQRNPFITGQGKTLEAAVEHLLTRAFRVIEDNRAKIERYNADQSKRAKQEARRMGIPL